MDEMRAGFVEDSIAGFVARSHGGFAEFDAAAVAFDGLAFYGGGVFRHDDPGRNAAPFCGTSYGGSVITAGLRDDAVADFVFGEREDRVGGAANFERPGLLQIFALEENAGADQRIDRRRGHDRGAMNAWLDASVRGLDGFPSDGLRLCSG